MPVMAPVFIDCPEAGPETWPEDVDIPANTSERSWVPPMSDPVRQIRLLKLPEVPGPIKDIDLQLKTFSLDNAPGYEALSYTWSNPIQPSGENCESGIQGDAALFAEFNRRCPTLPVRCNDHAIAIKRNLHNALATILRLFSGIWLWVDALCIDQGNEEEKIDQIRLMGEVYSQADRVIVWLGIADSDVLGFEDFYRPIAECVGSVTNLEHIPQTIQLLGHLSSSMPERALDGLCSLTMGRSYFSRRWTFQELALASSDVLLCGSFQFDLLLVYAIGLALNDAEPSVFSPDISRSWAVGQLVSSFLASTLRSRQLVRGQDEGMSTATWMLDEVCGSRGHLAVLYFLLTETEERFATDPTDIVYALLGLCTTIAEKLDKTLDRWTVPERDANCYSTTMKLMLSHLPFLAPLSYAGSATLAGRDSIRPSWLPGFAPILHNPLTAHWEDRENFPYASRVADAWIPEPPETVLAFRDLKIGAPRNDLDQAFRVHAVRVGAIAASCAIDVPSSVGNPADVEFNWRRLVALLELGQALGENNTQVHKSDIRVWLHLGVQDHEESATKFRAWAFWTTILKILSSNKPGLEPIDDVLDQLALFEGWLLKGMLGGGKWLKSIVTFLAALQENGGVAPPIYGMTADELVDNYTNSALHMYKFPCTLLKIGNGMVGFASSEIAEGDEVWILHRAKFPFILQKMAQDGHFKLIGEVCVHGIMHGEFLQGDGPPPWQEIWLV